MFFNILAGKNWGYLWDRDYWRLSAKQALLGLLNGTDESTVLIYYNGQSIVNQYMLEKVKQNRLRYTQNISSANYIIADYRNIIGEYPAELYPEFAEHQSIEVDGNKIMTIFKKKVMN